MRHALLPADPDDEQLARGWTLSEADMVEVYRCRGDHIRFSFALHAPHSQRALDLRGSRIYYPTQ